MAKPATELYECCVAFAVDLDGHMRSVRRGAQLRGDDPAYLAAPPYFCFVNARDAERPSVSDFIKTA
jgi:hypothetical protein